MRFLKDFFTYITIISLISCVGKEESSSEKITFDNEIGELTVMEREGIRISEVPNNKSFVGARLSLNSPGNHDSLKPGLYQFNYDSENFELGKVLENPHYPTFREADEGQHIQFSSNNSPVQARNSFHFQNELLKGNNVILAFLSTSYSQSIKSNESFSLVNYKVGETGRDFDMEAAHLFYSQPSGIYAGLNSEKILLDFFLVNTSLSENGNKVKATINDVSFLLHKWTAYAIEGLHKGTHTIRLELIDQNGNLIPGPFNDSGERTFEIKDAAVIEHITMLNKFN